MVNLFETKLFYEYPMSNIVRTVLVIALAFAIGTATPARASDAAAPVAAFQAGLIEVMKNAESLGVKGRYDALKPIIADNFSMPFMGALAAGNAWKQASDDQRLRFVKAFERLSIATLATLFSGYSNERFEVVGKRENAKDIVLIDTLLHHSDGDKVQLTYVAKRFGAEWRLIDVIVDGGISELKVRISEYNQTLKQAGLEGLIDLLNAKADQLLR